jgi:hypothetical protein
MSYDKSMAETAINAVFLFQRKSVLLVMTTGGNSVIV